MRVQCGGVGSNLMNFVNYFPKIVFYKLTGWLIWETKICYCPKLKFHGMPIPYIHMSYQFYSWISYLIHGYNWSCGRSVRPPSPPKPWRSTPKLSQPKLSRVGFWTPPPTPLLICVLSNLGHIWSLL